MANIPADLKYTKEHEWVRIEGNIGIVGITDHAQGELGDIVYVDIPDVGVNMNQGDVFGTIEAVKTVADLFAPVSGTILEFNAAVNDASVQGAALEPTGALGSLHDDAGHVRLDRLGADLAVHARTVPGVRDTGADAEDLAELIAGQHALVTEGFEREAEAAAEVRVDDVLVDYLLKIVFRLINIKLFIIIKLHIVNIKPKF